MEKYDSKHSTHSVNDVEVENYEEGGSSLWSHVQKWSSLGEYPMLMRENIFLLSHITRWGHFSTHASINFQSSEAAEKLLQ